MFLLRVSAAAAALSVSLPLYAAEESLEPVVVTAARVAQPISEVIGSVTVIDHEEIQRRQAQSVQELLLGETGFDISNSGGLGKSSSIYVRGANSSQTLILVDGVRLGSATAGTTSLELIPVEQIERIEIMRGPRSSLYGSDAIGGVIQIFTRRNDGVSASASAGTYDTRSYSGGFGMHGDGLRFNVNGNYLQSQGFDACVGSLGSGCFTSEPDQDGYRNGSVTARIGYAFGTLADLELSTLYTQGYTEFDGDFVNQTRFSNSAPTARLRLTPSDNLDITLVGGVTRDKSYSYKDDVYASRFNTEKRNASAQVDWRIGRQQLTLGADYLNDVVDSSIKFTSIERDNTGVYAQYLGKLATHEFSASLRHDDNQQFGTHDTGNLGWKWFVLDRALAINAGWGQGFHAPSFNDLYYPFGFGNPDLRPERSQSYELGVSGTVSWLDWSLQAYTTDATDLIALDANFVPENINKARLQGVELSLNGRWDKLNAAFSYTASEPRSRQAGSNYDHVLARRSRQSARLQVGYDLGVAQVAGTLNAVGKRFDDLANTQVLAGYTTLDLLTDVAMTKALSLQLKLGNVFDRRYETAFNYNQPGRTVYFTVRYQPGN